MPRLADALLRFREEAYAQGSDIWEALEVANLRPEQAFRQARKHPVVVGVHPPNHRWEVWTANVHELGVYGWGCDADSALTELVPEVQRTLPDELESFIRFESPPLPLILRLLITDWAGYLRELFDASVEISAEQAIPSGDVDLS